MHMPKWFQNHIFTCCHRWLFLPFTWEFYFLFFSITIPTRSTHLIDDAASAHFKSPSFIIYQSCEDGPLLPRSYASTKHEFQKPNFRWRVPFLRQSKEEVSPMLFQNPKENFLFAQLTEFRKYQSDLHCFLYYFESYPYSLQNDRSSILKESFQEHIHNGWMQLQLLQYVVRDIAQMYAVPFPSQSKRQLQGWSNMLQSRGCVQESILAFIYTWSAGKYAINIQQIATKKRAKHLLTTNFLSALSLSTMLNPRSSR